MCLLLCLEDTKTPAEPSQIALCGTDCEGMMSQSCCVQHRVSSLLLEHFIFGSGRRETRKIGQE